MKQSWSAQTWFLSEESKNQKMYPQSTTTARGAQEQTGPSLKLHSLHFTNALRVDRYKVLITSYFILWICSHLDSITCSARPSYCAFESPFTCETECDCPWGSLGIQALPPLGFCVFYCPTFSPAACHFCLFDHSHIIAYSSLVLCIYSHHTETSPKVCSKPEYEHS